MSTLFPIVSLVIVSLVTIPLENIFRGTLSRIILFFLYLAVCLQFLHSHVQLVIFGGAVVLGYLTDTLGVYCKKWYYNTSSGYLLWPGIGWAALTLVLLYSYEKTSLLALSILFGLSLLIISLRRKYLFQHTAYKFVFLLAKLSLFFVFPKLYILSFGIGILIEFLGVEVCKIWHYRKLSYLQIGTGYAVFMVYIQMLVQNIFYTPNSIVTVFLIAFPLGYTLHIVYNMFTHNLLPLKTPASV
jgi:hypothetical protein